MVKRLVEGKNPKNASRIYCQPNPLAELHNSMGVGWKVLEFIPKRSQKTKAKKKTWYIPKGEARSIPSNAIIHEAVEIRKNLTTIHLT